MTIPQTPTLEESFAAVQKLAADFADNQQHYLSPAYQESELRKDFLDKFLTALGWDVNHDHQKNPFQQEVKVERSVSTGGAQRRADYAFYIAPNFRDVRFFVEAKKPFGDIATPDNCFQTIRYGWSAKTLVAVLTDFEQFQILDCRYVPSIDTAQEQVVRKYHYSDYANPEKFAEIYYVFSRECVAAGSLTKYAESLPKRRGKAVQRGLFKGGYQSLDDTFLAELDEYRSDLARAFKNKNAELDGETLTEITQRVIDRLVFIRFLEDKMIEPEHVMAKFGDKGTPWQDFVAACRRLDSFCNGIVFKKHAIIDIPDFQVDDAVFAGICERLGSIHSPYNFNVIPIHILGSIYERFLGKVIVTTDKRARVEEKPEVRKAGGVYYTPEYIVRYIVENTVGKLIEGKTPAQIAEMRFADIACGSGSFLLGVYDLLLRYHRDWYNAHPAKAKKAGCEMRDDGAWHLSLSQRREILLNNIYGVDIDFQAVEVAQLSLYLKLLEEETTATARAYQLEFRESLLPPLNKNIVCGNSLIGTDILSGHLFEPSEEKKLNPMDFEDRFPAIMKRGGFDAIVGNPPYVRIQGFPRQQIDYFAAHYSAACGNFDLYVNFIEKGFNLLRKGGLVGLIVPNKFFKTDYGEGLRRLIAAEKALQTIVDFKAAQVFDATTYTCLLFLEKDKRHDFRYTRSAAQAASLQNLSFSEYAIGSLTSTSWVLGSRETNLLREKLTKNALRLLDLPSEISRGSSTGNDGIFILEACDNKLEREIQRIPLFASDFARYCFKPASNHRIIFPYVIEGEQSRLLAETEFRTKYPKTYAYLLARRPDLLRRKQFREWFGYSAPRNLAIHERAQICIPLLADRGLFTLIPPENARKLCPMASGGFTIALPESVELSPRYVLGLLNSALLFWYLQTISNVFRGGWITCTKQYFGELPIRVIDFSNPSDKSRHDRLVGLVDQMLETKKHLAAAKTNVNKNYYENKCAGLDRRIDALVYELYGLTPEEIRIVEGAQVGSVKSNEPKSRIREARLPFKTGPRAEARDTAQPDLFGEDTNQGIS